MEKLKKYIGKTKAKNIVLDTHGSTYTEDDPTENTIAFNSKGDQISATSFEKYPKNSPLVKEVIETITDIGNQVKSLGNFYILACSGGGASGDKIGKTISNYVKGKNVFLNTQLGSGTITKEGHKLNPNFTQKGVKKFYNGKVVDKGTVQIKESGTSFVFGN